MFSTVPISKDSNKNRFMNPKHVSEDVGYHFHYQNQNQQKSNGLARHRSAPSSFLQQFLDSINEDDAAEDNSSSGEDELEEALLFSALLNEPNHDLNQSTEAHVKEIRSGYVNDYCSGILRQSSSPAAFFSGHGTHKHSHEGADSSTGTLSNKTSFSSAQCSKDNGSKKRKHEESGDSHGLSHHLGSPGESLIQFHQETMVTTCQIRAKRGFATHPRSIAERNRRKRINGNMMKLIDVCPKINKQTSQADMLDMAFEYIKDLQNQVQILSDMDSKCACSSKHQEHNSIA